MPKKKYKGNRKHINAVLKGEFMAMNTYIRKEKKSQNYHLSSYVKNIAK